MSVAIEKSGTKPKIPPDDYIKSERSKRKKKSSMSRDPKPNLQKRISYRTSNLQKEHLNSIRELSNKEKNRRRIEEQREAQHFEYVKRTGSLKHAEIRSGRPTYQGIRRAASFGDPPKRRKRLRTRAERSRRAESVESSRKSGISQPKSQDSGIVCEESSDQPDGEAAGKGAANATRDGQRVNRSKDQSPDQWENGYDKKRRAKAIIDIQSDPDEVIRFHESGSQRSIQGQNLTLAVETAAQIPSLARPIVAFNNSDPDITIRFREQFRNLDLSAKPSASTKGPCEHLARSDSDLLNIGHSLGISFDQIAKSIDIGDKDISDSDKLDDANKLAELGRAEKGHKVADPLARLDDWINEVDQKQKDLRKKTPPDPRSHEKQSKFIKLETGWNSEADLCRPGSGLEQLSTFAERLVARKGKLIARHQSFAAIPSRPEIYDNSEQCESVEGVLQSGSNYKVRAPSIGDLPSSVRLPELSNSFRSKLAQWDNSVESVQSRRKKRGSSSASAVLQRMSLPVVSWVGGNRSPEKTKKTDFVVEAKEIKINSKGFRANVPLESQLSEATGHIHGKYIPSGDNEIKYEGNQWHRVKRLSNENAESKLEGECAVIPEWEAQQRDENREFRTQRKQRNKKCFPFSICS